MRLRLVLVVLNLKTSHKKLINYYGGLAGWRVMFSGGPEATRQRRHSRCLRSEHT